MIAVEYHTDLKEVQSDPELARLLGPECQVAPFDRLGWWQGLADHCGLSPLLAIAREGDDVAVLPLRAVNGQLEGLANWYTFRLRPVVSPGADGLALVAAMASDLSQKASRIVLSGLPEEEGSASLLTEAFRNAGWIIFNEACDTNHVLALDGRSYEEFLADRPGQLRSTIKRKKNKLESQVLTRFDEAAWTDYESIYAESWKPSEGSPDFLRAFAKAEGEAGRLRLAIARSEGRAVAAQMWTVEGNTAFIHKLAHREEAKPLSPGSVLSAALFEHVIDRDRVAMVDFGTGDDPYKRDWMEVVRLRYSLTMYRPGNPRNWPQIAHKALSRLAGRGNHG